MEKIDELETKVNELETENKNKLQSSSISISGAPTGSKVIIFHTNADITIATGKIPAYAKGIYIPNGNGNDAIIMAVDIVGGNKLITAIKSSGTWQSIRVI